MCKKYRENGGRANCRAGARGALVAYLTSPQVGYELVMKKLAGLVQLEAKPGQERAGAEFFASTLPLAKSGG